MLSSVHVIAVAITEIQIKTTLKYHLIPIRMAKSKQRRQLVMDKMWNKGILLHCW